MNEPDTTERLRRLEDRDAIRDVLTRYMHSFDLGDFERMATCFTPDLDATYSGVDRSPRDTLIEHLRGVAGVKVATHMLFQSEIDVQGDEATAYTYAIAVLVGDAKAGGDSARLRGIRYQDTFVRGDDGAWRICKRLHEPLWMIESAALPTGPAW